MILLCEHKEIVITEEQLEYFTMTQSHKISLQR